MRKIVRIGESSIELLANAATPYRFKQVFNVDLLKSLIGLSEGQEDAAVEVISQLAYIMRKQAIGQADKASVDDFGEWLESFDAFDLVKAAKDILSLYTGQTLGDSTAKKKSDR